jgi:predicted transposase/invertase (TIGR01784 family)
MEIGEARGIEKGKAEGVVEGKLESRLEIAKNLIAKGFDEKSIFEITGLNAKEIKQYFSKTP